MSTVFRVEKTKNYTVMSNYHLRDTSLSLKAKGLLSLMLSLPEEWDYSLQGLVTISMEGIDSIRVAVKELENNNYIKRFQGRNEKGQLTKIEYTIFEKPFDVISTDLNVENKPLLENPITVKNNEKAPLLENPTAAGNDEKAPLLENPTTVAKNNEKPLLEKPITDNPISENPMQLNKELLNKDILSKESNHINQSYQEEIRENDFDINIIRLSFKRKVEYDVIVSQHPEEKKRIDELIDIMTETMMLRNQSVNVGKLILPVQALQDRIKLINYDSMKYALECLMKHASLITNVKQYLLTVLFNAPVTVDNFYANEVLQDFGCTE